MIVCATGFLIWKIVVPQKYIFSRRKFYEEFKSDEQSMIEAKGSQLYIFKVFSIFFKKVHIFSVITCYHLTQSISKCHFWIAHAISLQKMYSLMGVESILLEMCWNKVERCQFFKILPRNAKGGEFKTHGLEYYSSSFFLHSYKKFAEVD